MKTFTTKHSILALMLLLLSQGVYAQSKEGNNWYFGAQGRMTWNTVQTKVDNGKTLTGLPTPLGGTSAMNSQLAGVFGMSDRDGNLLFYSDGVTVWNKNHQVMQNGSGMFGHNSSMQSGIVIPYPGQPDKYIAISISLNYVYSGIPSDRLAYSVIDMSLDNGLGAVIEGEKNILMRGAKAKGVLGESVSAVRHSNGVDYWIVAPGKGDGENSCLNVWKVTSSGVDIACVDSYPLAANTHPYARTNGPLRFSSDGKCWAWAECGTNTQSVYSPWFHFGEFNSSTGTFPTIKAMDLGYIGVGAEFSPSNDILYLSEAVLLGVQPHIFAYKFADLLAASNPPTGVVRQVHPLPLGNRLGTLQLAPDGRIYSAIALTSDFTVIDDPDSFENATLHILSGLMDGFSLGIGLPNFLSHIFAPTPDEGIIGNNQTICSGSTPARLTSEADAKCSDGVISETITYLWQQSTNGTSWSTATGTNNQATYQPPTLTATRHYRRRATSTTCGNMFSNAVTITIAPAVNAGTISSNQDISSGATPSTLTATAASGGVGEITYQWQHSTTSTTAGFSNISGATSATYSPPALTATTYYRRVASNCTSVNSNVVTITVQQASADAITVTGNATPICSGDAASLSASASSVTGPVFRWYSAATGGSLLHTGATYSPSPSITTTYHVSVGQGISGIESARKAVTVTVTPTATPDMIRVQ